MGGYSDCIVPYSGSILPKSQNVYNRRCGADFSQQAGKYCNKRDFKQFRI